MTILNQSQPTGRGVLLPDRVNDWLYISGAPVLGTLTALEKCGIERVIDLREHIVHDLLAGQGENIRRWHIPIPNYGTPSEAQFQEIVAIADALRDSAALLICCTAGIGRAPAVAAALLINTGISLKEAVNTVRAARPSALLAPRQIAWLHERSSRV